jgi:uncharacterized protein YbjT (DUF2867 family)
LARCLIIGCGCRGGELARELIARGLAVRGTTRASERLAEIEATGAEAVVADPDRVATLAPVLSGVAVVCVLLGSATGSRPLLEALHGPRLEMLLSRVIDTPVRGFVYEDAAGAGLVSSFCSRSRIPYQVVERGAGAVVVADAVDRALLGRASN